MSVRGSESFKSFLGESNVQPRLRTTTCHYRRRRVWEWQESSDRPRAIFYTPVLAKGAGEGARTLPWMGVGGWGKQTGLQPLLSHVTLEMSSLILAVKRVTTITVLQVLTRQRSWQDAGTKNINQDCFTPTPDTG